MLQMDSVLGFSGRLIVIRIIQLSSSLSTMVQDRQFLLKHDAALCRLSKKSISDICCLAIYMPV
ncbi:hypothetical protein DXT94_00760 [Rhizobium sp. ICMP 5592]|nr:hypothetical protein [Rhizobium sp. ICMP 5592]